MLSQKDIKIMLLEVDIKNLKDENKLLRSKLRDVYNQLSGLVDDTDNQAIQTKETNYVT